MDTNEGAPLAESTMPIPYKDRYAGLVVFGIFTILLGCLAALFVPLMLVGRMAAPAGSAQPPLSSILPAMIVYGILAVALVWLGIGSIMARRWARALLLIFSWSWLVMGVLGLIFLMIFLPKMLMNISDASSGHPAMPPEVRVTMMVTMAIIFGGIFVLMPAVWTFFYNSRHVKATCQARDPVMRWTDACPLPVLGLSAWLAFSAPMLLITPIITGHGVMPFFGMFLSGIPGGLFCLVTACVWGYAAWALYKLKPRGWWIIFIAIIVFMTSTVITFSMHDPMEMYRLMGYPKEQIAQIEKSGLFAGKGFVWLCMIWIVPFLGYLWFVRKFIFRKS